MNCNRSLFVISVAVALGWCLTLLPCFAEAETSHLVYFEGTEAQLDVYTITGAMPGPTLLLLGGIQGDEPGGYLAADLYADITLCKGNMIVVPRANFFSVVENNRGVEGDMNRKFAGTGKRHDRDLQIVKIIKDLMRKSDFFLNLHDGSGFFSPNWESPLRNPMRFGQSIIADAEEYTTPQGKVIRLGEMVRRVIERVNPQISIVDHRYKFNNHHTLWKDSLHKEQRLSATFHALTQVGIPAFASETSKTIKDLRLRVGYQSMVIEAFLDEFGIVPENPSLHLDEPLIRYLTVSINELPPIVLGGADTLTVQYGDKIRLVNIESKYTRGLTGRIRGANQEFSDLRKGVLITENTNIDLCKYGFVIGTIPVEIVSNKIHSDPSINVEPRVLYFCLRVNDRTLMVKPDEELTVLRGDVLIPLDPVTNLPEEDLKNLRIDLRGFVRDASPSPQEVRQERIDTDADLHEQYAQTRGSLPIFPLQAKLNNQVFAECRIAVAEPRLEYLVVSDSRGRNFVTYPGDKLELPENTVLKIMDVKTNLPESAPLFLTMMGKTVRWKQAGSAGIDVSRLSTSEAPLDVTRGGKSFGRIWLKQGKRFQLFSGGHRLDSRLLPLRY